MPSPPNVAAPRDAGPVIVPARAAPAAPVARLMANVTARPPRLHPSLPRRPGYPRGLNITFDKLRHPSSRIVAEGARSISSCGKNRAA